MTAPRSPREVLAALVERWVPDDDDLYGQYVDPLLNALDREGWEIVARGEVARLRDLCRRAADSAAGYRLIGGVYAELREAGELAPPPSPVAADPTTGTGT